MIVLNYVINLERNKDRWENINKLINSCCLKENNFNRFEAFDGKNYENEITKRGLENHPVILKLKENKAKTPAGAFGCFMSHVLILQKIAEDTSLNSNDYVGIYEDDFLISGSLEKFNENFKKFNEINLNELDVELIYLGGRFEPNFISFDEKLFSETNDLNIFSRNKNDKNDKNYDRTTLSYVVKKSSCKKIINYICNNLLFLVKEGQTCKPIDWILAYLGPNIKTFDYFPHFFYSIKDSESDIQGKNNQAHVLSFK